MFTVTEAARCRLLTKLVDRKAAEGEAFRFMRKDGGWKLRLDRAQPNDTKLVHEGRNVLLLNDDVTQNMTRLTLDVINAETKPRLTLIGLAT
jgi:hypothetical protein